VIAHTIRNCQALGWNAEDVCCIYPGVPFISQADLRSAYDILSRVGSGYVFPVTSFPSPIQRALHRLPGGNVKPFQPEYAATRTQDLEPAYYDVGQFYWGKAEAWLNGLNIHLHGYAVAIPEWRVVDIDTPADWERAQLLYGVLSEKGLL
jgi:CMP-N-acetylneuraminic acid synthetase